MKKSLFFKFFLFTVIATMVTFTACKDYDDDIDHLQDQITSMKGMSDELSAMKADIAAAKTSAADALAKANEALAKAEAAGDSAAVEAAQKDAADALSKIEELEGLEGKLTDMMNDLKATNEAQFEAQEEELKALMAELKAEVDDALGLMLGMVFDVELITDADKPVLTFSSAIEQENIFQTGMTNPITFVKGNQVQTGTSFVIRVSPSNVVVTPEMVSLQNSMGAVYENAKVTKVEPEEVLITRAANGGGYWRVHVELEKYDEKAFEAATKKGDEEVLFAAAVNNGGAEASSKVLTSYVIGMEHEPFKQLANLSYFVGEKHVSAVKNRKPGKEWKDGTPSTTPTDKNTIDSGDNRSDEAVYPAVQGEAIKIALTSSNDKVIAPNEIRGMYVTLDKENAKTKAELNFWESFDYTGLNTVVEGTETVITIDSKDAIAEEIGFLVFAVNHDGTLVDPDGKAFYVNLGGEASDWNAVNTVVTAGLKDANLVSSAKVATTLSKLTGAANYEWTTYAADGKADNEPAFNVHFEDKAKATVFATTANTGTVSKDFSDVTNVYTIATSTDWLDYKDDHVYNGKLTIKNEIGHVLATLNVTFKKVLPTAGPTDFSVITNQIVDGVYTAYLIPDNWTASSAKEGTMQLSNLFTFGNSKDDIVTTFANSSKDGDKLIPLTYIGDKKLTVGKDFIDNATKHATTVAYNYGKISTATVDKDKKVVDYTVTIEEFETVYSNIYNSTYSWDWATKAQLEIEAKEDIGYKTTIEYGNDGEVLLSNIYGVSTRNKTYNAFLNDPHEGSLKVNGAKLVTKGTEKEEYYSAEVDGEKIILKALSNDSNPTADVASTLIITAKDMYDNVITIELPFTVKKL